MDALKPIYTQVKETRDMWTELWFKMADGVTSDYERIKRTSVFEFWDLFDMWQAKLKKETKMYNSLNKKHGK